MPRKPAAKIVTPVKGPAISVTGAREHNLKNIDVSVPRNKLVVVCGLSGSGKSTLAFDTIFAEGQRRYMESLSSYARQFLGQMRKPDVDHIDGLSPAVSIDQKTTSKNPRSTVGTVTEIYDYLRLLWSRAGVIYCPEHQKPVQGASREEMIAHMQAMEPGTRYRILAPVTEGRKGEHVDMLNDLAKKGFVRVEINKEEILLDENIPELVKNQKHDIYIVVDRLKAPADESRLRSSLETALNEGQGRVIIDDGEERVTLSQDLSCPVCLRGFEALSPRNFSFNSPYGACPHCSGIGTHIKPQADLIVPDVSKSISEGAIVPLEAKMNSYWAFQVLQYCETSDIDVDIPWKNLPKKATEKLLYGDVHSSRRNRWGRVQVRGFEGVATLLKRRFDSSESDAAREWYAKFMRDEPCDACGGSRLREESRNVRLKDWKIEDFVAQSVDSLPQILDGMVFDEREEMIVGRVIKEIKARVKFLNDVGLGYLSLDRFAGSLSGGEAQRIRLASQVGSGLTGVLYVLDEPSIGLHARDNDRLIDTLKNLRDLGNSVIVVEHDEDTIKASDWVVDIGPGAGTGGGEVVYSGLPSGISRAGDSWTGKYLSGKASIPMPKQRKTPTGESLVLKGCQEHNLKNIDATFPLGLTVAVTGVSGSGKSTLVEDILAKGLWRKLHGTGELPGKHEGMEGADAVDKLVIVDQSPIGRTPRSNPATYTGMFDHIRKLFAELPESKARGYKLGRFSFNVAGGRCETCRGEGTQRIEMHFLPDVYVPCDVCKGARYEPATLEVKFKGKSIQDVLETTIEDARELFTNQPSIKKHLDVLSGVGLGYIQLGQAATTLSGGEAQRVKLASELHKRPTGHTMYVLDEPTTGLHAEDVRKLLEVLEKLRDMGNTIVVIEHNLDVIKTADWILDLGPEGGKGGGQLLVEGTPEDIMACEESYTGKWLKLHLDNSPGQKSVN